MYICITETNGLQLQSTLQAQMKMMIQTLFSHLGNHPQVNMIHVAPLKAIVLETQ